jgi:type IV pilus assembly protein PilF
METFPIQFRRLATLVFLTGILLAGCSTMSSTQKIKTGQAHYKLGISYLNDNQMQLAYIEFQKAVEINPKDKDSYYGLGHVYFTQGKFEEAGEEFKKAIRLDSNFSEAHNYLGTVYERMSQNDEAIKEYKKALENVQYITPHFARHNLGMIYLNAGDFKAAIQQFKEAISVAPDYALAYNGLGQAYYRDGQYKEAVEALNGALKIVPDYPEVHFYLGQTYIKTGSSLQAKQEFERVIRLAPDSELAKKAKQNLDLLH